MEEMSNKQVQVKSQGRERQNLKNGPRLRRPASWGPAGWALRRRRPGAAWAREGPRDGFGLGEPPEVSGKMHR